MTDRVPGAPGQYSAVIGKDELQKLQEGEPFAITLTRDDRPIKEGTPYSKAAVLPDAVAQVLCPEVTDPAPKDAFAALQEKKADAIQHRAGSVITATNSAYTPLKGLKLYGKTTQNGTPTPDAPVEMESAGDSGSVTVTVAGRNVTTISKISANELKKPTYTARLTNNYGTALSATTGDSVTITQSKWGNSGNKLSYTNGCFYVGFRYPLKVGDKITISFDYEVTDNHLSAALTDIYTVLNKNGYYYAKVDDNGRVYINLTITKSYVSLVDDWNEFEMRVCGTSGVFSNFQVAVGHNVTDYEPYKEPQTLTVSTPNGLHSVGSVQDEIDLARGVYIQRIGVIESYANEKITGAYMSTTGELTEGAKVIYVLDEPIEIALTEELAAYAKLHANHPTTTVYNDAGAGMEMTYYTPSTAVQMVHSPKDVGKFLSVDQHGCVVLTQPHIDAENVESLSEKIQEEVSLWHENVVHILRTEATNGWNCRLWSDGFVQMYATRLVDTCINEEGHCEVRYPLPYSLFPGYSVQVTACGKVFVTTAGIMTVETGPALRVVFEGEAGSRVSNVNLSVAGHIDA